MEEEVQINEATVMVTEFIRVFKASLDLRLWVKLIKEELQEYREASLNNDREEMLKEIVDLLYVKTGFLAITGGGITEGILQEDELQDWLKMSAEVSTEVEEALNIFGEDTILEAFRRVHASNMSKLDDNGEPILREDGKVMKGPNYKKPYLTDLLEGNTMRVEKAA